MLIDYGECTKMDGVREVLPMFLMKMDAPQSLIDDFKKEMPNVKTPADILRFCAPNTCTYILRLVAPCLSREDVAEIWPEIWAMNDSPDSDPNVSKAQAVRYFQLCKPEQIMCEKDLEVFKSLPEEITVYRGLDGFGVEKKNVKALSWTLNLEKAKWFTHRFDALPNSNSAVYQARINKKYVFAYDNERDEEEIILDYHKLKDIQLVTE